MKLHELLSEFRHFDVDAEVYAGTPWGSKAIQRVALRNRSVIIHVTTDPRVDPGPAAGECQVCSGEADHHPNCEIGHLQGRLTRIAEMAKDAAENPNTSEHENMLWEIIDVAKGDK